MLKLSLFSFATLLLAATFEAQAGPGVTLDLETGEDLAEAAHETKGAEKNRIEHHSHFVWAHDPQGDADTLYPAHLHTTIETVFRQNGEGGSWDVKRKNCQHTLTYEEPRIEMDYDSRCQFSRYVVLKDRFDFLPSTPWITPTQLWDVPNSIRYKKVAR